MSPVHMIPDPDRWLDLHDPASVERLDSILNGNVWEAWDEDTANMIAFEMTWREARELQKELGPTIAVRPSEHSIIDRLRGEA